MTTAKTFLPLGDLSSARSQQSSSRASGKPKVAKGGLSRMKHNAQLSERGKTRTAEVAAEEEAADRVAAAAAAADRKEAAREAFSNRTRAVTFLPASQEAVIEGTAVPAAHEEVEDDDDEQAFEPEETEEEETQGVTQEMDGRQKLLLDALLVK